MPFQGENGKIFSVYLFFFDYKSPGELKLSLISLVKSIFDQINPMRGVSIMTKNQANSKFMKPMTISSELAEVVGKGPMPRTEVTKKLWAYIKKNNRQDPENKRNIVPDEKLSKVFGGNRAINMFDMTKKVNNHLS